MIYPQDLPNGDLEALLERYGLSLITVTDGEPIPGSFWGGCEAGLIDNRVYARADTPLHSILHESCHYICMDRSRREDLHTDAGGGYDEENGVCYLQLLLADQLQGIGRMRQFSDMDDWGYSFRLGSSQAWFERDAEDAVAWLLGHGLIDNHGITTWCLRD
jgi:hypothetical protein